MWGYYSLMVQNSSFLAQKLSWASELSFYSIPGISTPDKIEDGLWPQSLRNSENSLVGGEGGQSKGWETHKLKQEFWRKVGLNSKWSSTNYCQRDRSKLLGLLAVRLLTCETKIISTLGLLEIYKTR